MDQPDVSTTNTDGQGDQGDATNTNTEQEASDDFFD